MPAILLAVILAAQCPDLYGEQGELPYVIDNVAAVIFVQDEHFTYLVFIVKEQNKPAKILTHRYKPNDLVVTPINGGWCLQWQDYWTADRVVYTPEISMVDASEFPDFKTDDSPWWAANRRMTDLTAP